MTQELYADAYKRGYDRTVRFLLSRGVNSDDAREAAQAAWARGWERIAQLRDHRLVVTWVNSIALNSFRAGLRHPPETNILPEIAGAVGINVAAIDVGSILTRCRPQDRQLFLSYLAGETTREIAHKQGVTETAIRLRFLRARREARWHATPRASTNMLRECVA